MSALPDLGPELRALIEHAGIAVLRPAVLPGGPSRAGAQTTTGAGGRVLTAVHFEFGQEPIRLEVTTLVRERILASRRDPGSVDGEIIAEYLEREARRELATRSLELPEGSAERLTTPLDRLILAREAALPAAGVTTITVDAIELPAHAITFEAHDATWADLPAHRAAVILYRQRWPAPPDLVAAR